MKCAHIFLQYRVSTRNKSVNESKSQRDLCNWFLTSKFTASRLHLWKRFAIFRCSRRHSFNLMGEVNCVRQYCRNINFVISSACRCNGSVLLCRPIVLNASCFSSILILKRTPILPFENFQLLSSSKTRTLANYIRWPTKANKELLICFQFWCEK